MTKKHFEALAQWFYTQLRDGRFTAHNGAIMASELASTLARFNGNFDPARFRQACLTGSAR